MENHWGGSSAKTSDDSRSRIIVFNNIDWIRCTFCITDLLISINHWIVDMKYFMALWELI